MMKMQTLVQSYFVFKDSLSNNFAYPPGVPNGNVIASDPNLLPMVNASSNFHSFVSAHPLNPSLFTDNLPNSVGCSIDRHISDRFLPNSGPEPIRENLPVTPSCLPEAVIRHASSPVAEQSPRLLHSPVREAVSPHQMVPEVLRPESSPQSSLHQTLTDDSSSWESIENSIESPPPTPPALPSLMDTPAPEVTPEHRRFLAELMQRSYEYQHLLLYL